MEKEQAENQSLGLTTARLEALTDGVFAIAMTLLVLNLDLPETAPVAGLTLSHLLFGQTHKFFNYALSFLYLSIFWVIHHQQFHRIKRTDRLHIWLNMVILMFVALIPFSTDLVGDFRGETLSEAFFAGNFLVLGLLFWANWGYASGRGRLIHPQTEISVILRAKRRTMVLPAISFLALILAFIIPGWSSMVFLLIPFILMAKKFR